MPERAEIAIMAEILNKTICGKCCEKIVIMSKYKKEFYSSINLTYLNHNGTKYINVMLNLISVTSRGKKIIFDLGSHRFVSSCGMTGTWNLKPSINTSLVLMFSDINIYYDEKELGGNFSICEYPSENYNNIFKNVGPDLGTDEVTWDIYYYIIKNTRDIQICDFMLDQKYMSGIGNYLRAEILYHSKINPHRFLSSLNDSEIYSLFYYSKIIIYEAYQNNGLTIQDYLSPDGKRGTYDCKCYGKDIDNNGYRILKDTSRDGRNIYWCPEIQK